jgi:tetrapyrrole methylase family protein/MazG family protein
MVPAATLEVARAAARCLVRTERHPAVAALGAAVTGPVEFLDRLYTGAGTFDDVYAAIVEEVVAAAAVDEPPFVAYLVPGSPLVAERTVAMLRRDPRVRVEVVPAMSFLDLAWARLGVDPVAAGVRLVDGTDFAATAAGERGPLLVAQCHRRELLSEMKLAADDAAGEDPARTAVLLHHLGLDDETVVEVPWADLDRSLEPDHLTSVWVPRLAPPVGAELVGLEELVRTLRARCPWDRLQTHGSLARHLLEESYEALDAIEAVAATEPDVPPEVVAHLKEELGDLLFQVYFHARLATEEGRFTLADVARSLHHKLVQRHPHVFGDAVADTPEDVAARWEVLKKAEKGRASVTDGIPAALPALALAAKLQRKAESLGIDTGSLEGRRRQVAAGIAALAPDRPGAGPGGREASGETLEAPPATVAAVGELLFALADAARRLGVDPESALRARAGEFRRQVEAAEASPGAAERPGS